MAEHNTDRTLDNEASEAVDSESRSTSADATGGIPENTPVDPATPEVEDGNQSATAGPTNESAAIGDQDSVRTPQFQPLTKSEIKERPITDVSRLKEVKVVVSAELGRTKLPIQQLLSLSDGSVVELHRNVDAPVELMAQGVPLGNGEVVVVDDCFAIRIKEIYSNS